MPHQATESLSFGQALRRMPVIDAHLHKVLRRLEAFRPVLPGERILDVGAAQGLLVMAAARAGYDAVGVEPDEGARRLARRLALHEGGGVDVRDGSAEELPVDDAEFDFVHANSVFEHVRDPAAAVAEAARVLKPGGVLWFATASSLCPRQDEIARFPAFGWYPLGLKRRIMRWAAENRPHLIGHTAYPAMHWFTPRKVRRMLAAAGFSAVRDRWDLRLPAEGGGLHAAALKCIRCCRPSKLLADVVIPHCSYAAVK